MKRQRRTPAPGAVILLGRLVSQAGFFVFLITPAISLSDDSYNNLIVAITVMLLAVVAPVSAFQQHLLRLDETPRAAADSRRKSVALATACSGFGLIVLTLFGEPSWWWLALAAGAVLNALPNLTSSLHALAGRYGRSAILDGASGAMFAIVAAAAILLDVNVVGWSAAYLLVWATMAVAALLGPLACRSVEAPISTGDFFTVVRAAKTMIGVGIVAMAYNRADYLALTLVGSETESARYALAGRVVGPVMIALGSLNNSLYVRQIRARQDPVLFHAMTARASRRVGALAIAVAPLSVAGVWLLGQTSESLESRNLIAPTLVLALATVPFAYAAPWGFALNAQNREGTWLRIIGAATVLDLLAVLLLGSRGAVAVGLVWLAVQCGVWVAVTRLTDPANGRRRSTVRIAR